MNRRQFAGVLGISGLSAGAYSLLGGTCLAEASAADTLKSAADILKEEGFAGASVDHRVLQYATTGALPFWVAGTFANQWLRNLDFYQLPQSLINKYRDAGAAYRSLDGAESVWRTIPEAMRREGPDALKRFHSDKDWSHIIPRSAGGNDLANNGIFEKAALNRARGATIMTGVEIQTARQALNSEALRSAIRQTVGLTLVGALVPAVVETIFAVLEYGLDYQEGRITEKELYISVGKRFMTTASTAVVVSGVIAGLVMVFPVFLPILSALTIPAAAASFLLLGIRFYRLGREWLTRMGIDPTVEVWNRSKAISNWTWRATTGALGRAWGATQDLSDQAWDATQGFSGQTWGATSGALGRTWGTTQGVSHQAWDATQDISGQTWDATQDVSERTWGNATGSLGRAWGTTQDVSDQAWDSTQDLSGRARDAAQDLSGRVQDTAQDLPGRAWNATKDAAGRAQQGATDRLAPESAP